MHSTAQIALFARLFAGRIDAFGTYDWATRRTWQVKEPVTLNSYAAHLRGERALGIYPLKKDTVRFAVVDFDQDDTRLVSVFCDTAKGAGFVAHVERSKSKGYH